MVQINNKHYSEVWKARRNIGIEKIGYSFLFSRFLGENGHWDKHPMEGKRFKHKEEDRTDIFIVERVYLHWYNGYYFMALAHRESDHSSAQISWKVNGDSLYDNIDSWECLDEYKTTDLIPNYV